MARLGDFSRSTILTLSAAAGHSCSRCKASTSAGSETDKNKSVNLGVAAHILAAGEKGPRFSKSQSPDERSDIDNVIWLCEMCASLIDKNNGIDFSPEELREMKRRHEAEVRENLGRAPSSKRSTVGGLIEASGIGEVTGADIRTHVVFEPGTRIRASGIGRVTGLKIGGD
jgi:hypothetical protein